MIGVFHLLQVENTLGAVHTAALDVPAGTVIEGSVVGTAQWLVMSRSLKRMKWRTWVLAMALGACGAWTLRLIPSTFLFTGSDTGGAAPAQMSDLMTYALAATMGMVLGTILDVPQWLVQRRCPPKAG